MSAANTTTNGKDSSYDYASEEKEYQEMMRQKQAAAQREMQEQAPSRRLAATHKRNRMSMDNKAYQPSQSDIEGESDDDVRLLLGLAARDTNDEVTKASCLEWSTGKSSVISPKLQSSPVFTQLSRKNAARAMLPMEMLLSLQAITTRLLTCTR